MFKYFKQTISVATIVCTMHANTSLYAYHDMLRETSTAISEHTQSRLVSTLTNSRRDRHDESIKTSASGHKRLFLKGLKNTAAAIVAAVGIYGGTVVYRDWFSANQRDVEALALEETLPLADYELITSALREFYLLIDEDQPHATRAYMNQMQIGKIALIIQNDIIDNMNFILRYSKENNIDPQMLAAIILTEQLDMYDKGFIREISTDRLSGLLGRDSSIGLGQVRISTFKRLCAGMLWPQISGAPLTEHLSRRQIITLLEDPQINIMVSAMAIADARDSLAAPNITSGQSNLMLAQAYTSSARAEVPEPPYTREQVENEERYRSYVYAHWVMINKALLEELLFFGETELLPQARQGAEKASSSGINNVMPHTMVMLDDNNPLNARTTLRAVLEACLAVIGYNPITQQRFLAHVLPVGHIDYFSDFADQKVLLSEQEIRDRIKTHHFNTIFVDNKESIKRTSSSWQIVVLRSGDFLEQLIASTGSQSDIITVDN